MGMIGFVLVTSLLMAAPAAATAAPAPDVRVTTLGNGLSVLLAPDSTALTVDVSVWYRAGARQEPPGQSGIARLLGRLMFRGTARHPAGDHARLIQTEGGSVNTILNADYSCFSETVPPGALELALGLEAERMRGLTLAAPVVDAERAALAAQQRQAKSALELGLDRLYALAFPGDPYGRPLDGTPADLPRLTAEVVQRFYRARFAPENAMVCVVGRFEPAPTLAAVRRLFGALPRGAAAASKAGAKAPARPPANRPVAVQKGARRAVLALDAPTPVLIAGWRTPGAGDSDRVAYEVMSRLLTGGASARLPRTLTGQGRAFVRAQGGFEPNGQASMLYCVLPSRPGTDTTFAEQAMVTEVERLAEEPVAPAELERARRQLESEILFGWQAARVRGQSLGAAQFVAGDYRKAWGRLERLRALSADDVQRAAARALIPDHRNVVWLMPRAGTPSGPGGSGGGR